MRANLGQAQLRGRPQRSRSQFHQPARCLPARRRPHRQPAVRHRPTRRGSGWAQLSPNALEEAHWQGAQGIASGSRSHAAHNAGVTAFEAGHWPEAEQLFSDAIRSDPGEPLSWVARGISRSVQAKDDLAASDFRFAASLFQANGLGPGMGEPTQDRCRPLNKRRFASDATDEGKGMGGQFLQGAMAGLRMLAPIAAKALIPLGPGVPEGSSQEPLNICRAAGKLGRYPR